MLLHAHVQPQQFTLQYQVTNTLSEPLFLNNQVFDWYDILKNPAHAPMQNRNASPTTSLAYVALARPDEVSFYTGDVPMPFGILAAAPRVPLSTRLAPGESTTVTIRLALPLDEWHPYEPPNPARSNLIEVSTVRVCIEAIRQSATRYADKHPSFSGVWRVGGYPPELIEARASLNAPLPVRMRTDPVYRPT